MVWVRPDGEIGIGSRIRAVRWRERTAGSTSSPGEAIRKGSQRREAEVGATGGSSVARGSATADGKESSRDRQAAVVGLALGFALIIRPAGSQGSAPAKAHEEIKNNKTPA